MATSTTFDRPSPLKFTPAAPLKSVVACDGRISYIIAKFLQNILPNSWFCWISRASIQVQSILRPIKWSYWTKLSDHMYVGAIPLKNWDHVDKITKLGVKAILAMNEEREFNSQLFADPAKAVDWEKKNIEFLNIPSTDLEGVGVEKLAKAVNYVVSKVKENHPVYIHCTAGRARSVSVAVCSLIKLNSWTLEQSFNFVQSKRHQFMVNQKQINDITEWYEIYQP